MKVEVDTSDITALEQRVEQLTVWLTVAISKLPKKTLTIEAGAVEVGAGVEANVDGDTLTLTYKAP